MKYGFESRVAASLLVVGLGLTACGSASKPNKVYEIDSARGQQMARLAGNILALEHITRPGLIADRGGKPEFTGGAKLHDSEGHDWSFTAQTRQPDDASSVEAVDITEHKDGQLSLHLVFDVGGSGLWSGTKLQMINGELVKTVEVVQQQSGVTLQPRTGEVAELHNLEDVDTVLGKLIEEATAQVAIANPQSLTVQSQ